MSKIKQLFADKLHTIKAYPITLVKAIFDDNGDRLDTILSRKAEKTEIPTSLPANGGNADTVDNKHASDFAEASHSHVKADITDFPSSLPADGGNADSAEKLNHSLTLEVYSGGRPTTTTFDGSQDKTVNISVPVADTYKYSVSTREGGFNFTEQHISGTTPSSTIQEVDIDAKTLGTHSADYFATADDVSDVPHSSEESTVSIDTPTLDADKLGGQAPSYYATQSSLNSVRSELLSDIVNIGKYTSTETEIGTWFNGEKLYRLCVYLGTISANSENEHSIGIAVGNIPMVEVFGFQGHRFRRSMKVDFVDKNTGQIKFINDSVVDLYDSVLIVEYIKQ